MRRIAFPTLALLALLAACNKGDSPKPPEDPAGTAAAAPLPKNPMVMAFDLGRAVDSSGRIIGGTTNRYAPMDTIYLSVRTIYVTEGANVSARILQGKKTMDSLGIAVGKSDSTGVAPGYMRFGSAKGWPTARYQVEVFLDGKSQGLKEFTVQP